MAPNSSDIAFLKCKIWQLNNIYIRYNNTIGQAVPLIMKEVYACGKHINDLGNSVPKVRTNLCHSLFAEWLYCSMKPNLLSINGCLWQSLFWPSDAFFFTFNFKSVCSPSSSIFAILLRKNPKCWIFSCFKFSSFQRSISTKTLMRTLHQYLQIFIIYNIYKYFGTTFRRFAAPMQRSPPRKLRMPIGAVAYKLGSSHQSFGYKGCPKNIDFNLKFYWPCCLQTWMKVLWSWLTFYWFQECYNTFYLSPDNKQNESTSFLIDSVIYFFFGDTLCVYICIFMHLCFSFGSHPPPPPPPPSPAPTTPAREFQVKIHCCGFTLVHF